MVDKPLFIPQLVRARGRCKSGRLYIYKRPDVNPDGGACVVGIDFNISHKIKFKINKFVYTFINSSTAMLTSTFS